MTCNYENEFPIQMVREQFPALKRTHNGREVAYFDGPGGSQVVEASIEAIAGYMRRDGANLHGQFPSSHETEEIIKEAKESLGDLLGAKPKEIALGANTTTLAFAVARALGRSWRPGDEIVVSEIDHKAGADPWITEALDKGVTVRWLKVNPETFTLDLSDLESIINEKTVLVGIALASNAVGTINDVSKISKRAKEVRAAVAVDCVHAVPHIAMDRDKLGADILLCSVYKFFGPHIGVAAIREEKELKLMKIVL
jgi:selenocysteine lyase/cysteine desulfurase